MGDTVNSDVIEDGLRNYTIHMQNTSDGTGESAVKKVDASTLVGPQGFAALAPSYFAVKSIRWAVADMDYVQLLFDATTDDEMFTCSGTGYEEFDPPLNDPQTTGTTGDILLTTAGALATGSYDITLSLIKKK